MQSEVATGVGTVADRGRAAVLSHRAAIGLGATAMYLAASRLKCQAAHVQLCVRNHQPSPELEV
jgi:hypothetical protein